MFGLRGRALYYPALLICAWIGGRITYLNWDYAADPPPARKAPVSASQTMAGNSTLKIADVTDSDAVPASLWLEANLARHLMPVGHRKPAASHLTLGVRQVVDNAPHDAATLLERYLVPAFAEAESTARPLLLDYAEDNKQQKTHSSHWSGYAYSFWRFGGDRGAVAAPGGQYGGSQTGAILSYDIGGERESGLALLARAAATPSRGGEEVAIGVRWHKPAKLPLSLSVERRMRLDAKDNWAMYVAGGIDALSLPAGFKLDSYAQAGWTSGGTGGGFYDGQARVTKKFARIGGVTLKAGAGAWAGGQKDASRLDVGPTVSGEFSFGKTALDLRLDCRYRIGGNAASENSVAMTLSTGF